MSHFVNRPTLLTKIEERLTDDSPRKPVILVGMGGSGKTQLALELCRLAEEEFHYMAVIWIRASSPASVKQSYQVAAQKLSRDRWTETDSRAIEYVKDTLEGWERRWLLIFDDYDNPKAFQSDNIKNYFPRSVQGSILITSRHWDSTRLGYKVDVCGMSSDESLNLLLQSASISHVDTVQGEKIAKTLGYLPLALDQAGAYIRARSIRLEEFLLHYDKRRQIILKETPWEWEYRKLDESTDQEYLSVFTTW